MIKIIRANQWKQFGISARVIVIIMLPVMLMFSSIVAFTYYSRLAEVNEELAERGHVISTALAESSEYEIISGNLAELKRTTKGLVDADSSIYQIDILDAQQHIILHIGSTVTRNAEHRVFNSPIHKHQLSIDAFSDEATPQVSDLEALMPKSIPTQIFGYVQVTMSPSKMMLKQKNRIYFELIMVFIAVLVSVLFAFKLARSLTVPLATVIAALRAIRAGNYQTHVNITTGGEIGDLQSSINEMSISLYESKRDLENKIIARTHDLEASRNEALKSDAEKRRLIQKINSIVEDERKNIAVEIHDELNATLIATRLNAQSIISIAAKSEPTPSIEKITERAHTIVKYISSLYASARTIVRRLRPEILDMLGLQGAIEEIVQNYDVSHPECSFEFSAKGNFSALDSGLDITAYRLVQEALSNIVKHAAATKTTVNLNLDGSAGILYIDITDNGLGFNPQTINPGIGIIGMRERVYAFNGEVAINTVIGKGTKISIIFPIDLKAAG